jgi:hypothetical protein
MENQRSEFNINDLASLKNIIELACTRGAFRASEMTAVGEAYQRLDTFLAGVLNQAQSQQAAGEEPGPESQPEQGEAS